MEIVSEDPLKIDMSVVLPEEPDGRVRKFAPGEALPEHCRAMMVARAAGVDYVAGGEHEEPQGDEGDGETQEPAPIIALTIDVAEATVADVEAYLEANPSHAETVMEAEEVATGGEPRKGIANAVAEALEA